jgi:hypothetical protein
VENKFVLLTPLSLVIQIRIFFLFICSNAHANMNKDNGSSLTFINPGFDKDLGVLGEWKANALLSGFGMLQSNPDQTSGNPPIFN